MTAFTLSVSDGIGRLVLDLPGEPVNKITRGVRDELDALLTRLGGDTAVRAVVLLSGKPDTFIAGADIDEFVKLGTRDEAYKLVRGGQMLIERIPDLGKPVVAAIRGACLGGGLEARLRAPTAWPRTTRRRSWASPRCSWALSRRPAAVSLPRLIGVQAALDIILAG